VKARITRIDTISSTRSSAAAAAGCLPNAGGTVTINSFGPVESLHVKAFGLRPNTHFDLFVIQLPDDPFGLAWYQGDILTNSTGTGAGDFVGRFSIKTFIVAPGVGPAPDVFTAPPFPDATMNPSTGPIQTYHLGLWFNLPADAAAAGCPNTVTPFNGTHNAGIQALSTRNFPNLAGPLSRTPLHFALFNTGVSNSSALLPGGATDPHYALIKSADPSFPGPAAIVVNPTGGYPIPPWMSDGPLSEWIALSANEDTIDTSGLYVYRTTFNLTGLYPGTAVITGKWSTDNNGVDILINGVSTGITHPDGDSSGFTSFTISKGFVSGLNTLDFEVNNGPTGGSANPTGLRVELSGTAVPVL